ncbi:hypothetical protein C0Q70_20296 [Pomacea canaliculata]|uniref:Neurotransmitter-gated ion-channel ligand-binding domain-containing protein n=1 Tax=Pomacea canaliculata TaxID=400727 RepID=A0A2T7NF83_POMCA|nr:hypothetical protein C0Q70_20296 [Pomacea canaliculata]
MKEGVEGSAAASSSSSTSLQPSSSGPPTIENHQPTVEHHHPTVDHQPLPQLRYQKALRPEERQGNLPDEQRLLNYIMRGYEKSVRPVRNASTPVVIRMGLTLTQIFDMDEKDQVLVTNVWLDQEWVDEFLVWDPMDFNNITMLRIPCHKIWLPDIVLYNNAAEYTDGLMPANAMIDHTGNVFWPVPTKLQSSCKVDVTYFPFDYQTCKLKFGSWTYDGYQVVDITNRTTEVDLSNYVVNGEWELIYIRIVRNVVRYACCDEPFPDVTFYVRIRRRTLYYMYNVVFPCVMMSALTLLVFCLPPDSGEKIALGITVLLAFSVFMLAVAENLPETSEFVPLISIYLTIVMSLTSISVIMTVFVLNLHHRGPDKRDIPPWLRALFMGNVRTRSSFMSRRSYNYAANDAAGHLMRNMSLKVTLENLAHELREEMCVENGGLPEGGGHADSSAAHVHQSPPRSPRSVPVTSVPPPPAPAPPPPPQPPLPPMSSSPSPCGLCRRGCDVHQQVPHVHQPFSPGLSQQQQQQQPSLADPAHGHVFQHGHNKHPHPHLHQQNQQQQQQAPGSCRRKNALLRGRADVPHAHPGAPRARRARIRVRAGVATPGPDCRPHPFLLLSLPHRRFHSGHPRHHTCCTGMRTSAPHKSQNSCTSIIRTAAQ